MQNYILCFQRTTKNPKFVDAKVSYLQIGRTYGEIGEKYGGMIRQTVAAKTESGVRVGQRLRLLVATAEIFLHDLETNIFQIP